MSKSTPSAWSIPRSRASSPMQLKFPWTIVELG